MKQFQIYAVFMKGRKPMKHAVFFDIDGTLLDEELKAPESAVTAVRRLRENGDYAFLCSGRTKVNIYAKQLKEIGFDGIIAGCGAHIEYHGDTVYEKTISEEDTKELLLFFSERRIPVVLEGRSRLFADIADFMDDPYILKLKDDLGELFCPLAEFETIHKFTAGWNEHTREQMTRNLSGKYELLFHEARYVEGMPKGISKATGIRWICDYLGIAHENTFAFGDSVNDLEMLRYVKTGIAMGNATDVAKEAADYVTSSLHEDGIYRGLKHFSLI